MRFVLRSLEMGELARGYALGVRDATPPGYSYGVNSDQDVARFAQAYAKHCGTGEPLPSVREAFGEWRFSGRIVSEELAFERSSTVD